MTVLMALNRNLIEFWICFWANTLENCPLCNSITKSLPSLVHSSQTSELCEPNKLISFSFWCDCLSYLPIKVGTLELQQYFFFYKYCFLVAHPSLLIDLKSKGSIATNYIKFSSFFYWLSHGITLEKKCVAQNLKYSKVWTISWNGCVVHKT